MTNRGEDGKPIRIIGPADYHRKTGKQGIVKNPLKPGLRHLYNTHLKTCPGLAGSTTSAPDFDAQVARQVMSWRFEPA